MLAVKETEMFMQNYAKNNNNNKDLYWHKKNNKRNTSRDKTSGLTIFYYKSQTSDRRVETNKSRVDINSSRIEIEVTLFKQLFWLWCSRKEWKESFPFKSVASSNMFIYQ